MAMTYNNKTRRRPHIAQADIERRLVFFIFLRNSLYSFLLSVSIHISLTLPE